MSSSIRPNDAPQDELYQTIYHQAAAITTLVAERDAYRDMAARKSDEKVAEFKRAIAAENVLAAVNARVERMQKGARYHAVELEQCSIFADDVGPAIGKAMRDAAAFLRASLTGGENDR